MENSIAFIDTEIEFKSRRILDIGCIKGNGSTFHNASSAAFSQFIKGTKYVCGHNIIDHDLKYIGPILNDAGILQSNYIDTLFLSPLLFPSKPYHALLKDDKLQIDDLNNPLNDSIKAKDLFFDEVAAFQQTDELLQRIFYQLLKDKPGFQSFFLFLAYSAPETNIETLIRHKFQSEICEGADLTGIISDHPIALSYCLSLINTNNRYSITPRWVLKNYPEVERIMLKFRNRPCISGCSYCNKALDISHGLKRYFGYDSFRTYGNEPLQEMAVKAAIDAKSILAVFPTGGGKSITFQVPALMSGENAKGLTVVISPLQSLMKDQVDNLEKNGITDAVTINGLLDPIERAKSFERVEDGSAFLLYISPESLRSKTIERLLLGRKIIRFVIDEAHCFSSWGQDFRVDYLYIGDFIKALQEKKKLEEGIPVSCFTATAKQKVIEDIRDYFRKKLSIELELFTSKATRTNLTYKVIEKTDDEDKYQTVRDLIIEKNCPTIIYVSRTRKADFLSDRLTGDGFNAKPFHGKMDSKDKTANQNSFIEGEVQIIVATSAFGMGVDKKDVGLVIHYEISDSLENYIQEAGRAGRDDKIVADCFALFNEDDLSKHFILLNQTRLSIKEIQQIWKAIKEITRFRSTMSYSALEIARKAGWDDNIVEIETRVTTAIAALEDAGYLMRGQNVPQVFANSILAKNVQEAVDKINASTRFDEKQKEKAVRVIKKLISSKSRKQANEEIAESRIDYIGDHLGIRNDEVIRIVTLLREEKILSNEKDLTAFIKREEGKNRSFNIIETYSRIEIFFLQKVDEQEKKFKIKELNEEAEGFGCDDVTPNKIKTVINFWAIKNWIKKHNSEYSKKHVNVVCLHSKDVLIEKLNVRHQLAKFIVEFLFQKINPDSSDSATDKELLVEFSVLELKVAYDNSPSLFKLTITVEDIEDTLFYLSRIEAIKIEGGFLVTYNRLSIERIEQDNKKRYKVEDYEKLNQFYENKIQQIHIVGEYAKKMIDDYKKALRFVDDYFQLNYTSFLNKYFKGGRQNEIKRTLTPAKFKQLFSELSPTQLKIISDKDAKYIAILAGPGSGKTKVLVHKLASLLLMEDVKQEQLLMVTFSRAAATEFKKQLKVLIGNAIQGIAIKTFHSYCFDLLGKVGNLEKSEVIIKTTIGKIKNKEVEINQVTKTVLVIDEAQDMDENEFNLVRVLMEQNEDMRVIAVGDDDQNIYEFRGASSRYLEQFIEVNNAVAYELVENYRSKENLVDFSNQFAAKIESRLKRTPIIAKQSDNGEIKIVRYQGGNLISPVVQDMMSSDLIGTTCVLTKTNEEALQTTGVLLRNGMHSKLIQSNDEFNLYHLAEIRYFLRQLTLSDDVNVIHGNVWSKAKRELNNKFHTSTKLELCNNIIKVFESSNPKIKYISDLEVFIRESQLENFYNESGKTIFVSTIHKSKGKEFDNVFLMLDNYRLATDESKRLLYVAMTRAKKRLVIHLNSDYLDSIDTRNLERMENLAPHLPPNELAMHLTHQDVCLSCFNKYQLLIPEMMSGDELKIEGNKYLYSKDQEVLKFSQSFEQQIESLKSKNYILKSAKVNFILYWQGKKTNEEIQIILPELHFEKI